MKKTQKRLQYRMYFLTMYNISEIQKGIQCLHATVEYELQHGDSLPYKNWAKHDKTVILLNGGTSNDKSGSIQAHIAELQANNVPIAFFREPDLNNAISAVAFIVDERVWSKKYPDSELLAGVYAPGHFLEEASKNYVKSIGGSQNAFLKTFLKKFRLA